MRMSAVEEYGIRCLVQLARAPGDALVPIADISSAEGISPEYTAKLLRILREGGLVTATRGASGGYRLSRPAEEMSIGQIISVLDGPLIGEDWCARHSGKLDACVHDSTACSLDALWGWVSRVLAVALEDISLADLASGRLHLLNLLADRSVPSLLGTSSPALAQDRGPT